MKVTSYNSQINYTSNIRIVNSNEFNKHFFDEYLYCGHPADSIKESVSKVRGFWTPSVRTCTAGGVVDNDGVLGFHLYDCLDNLQQIHEKFRTIISDAIFKPKSALILGSKNIENREASLPIFDTVESIVTESVKPSIFKTHRFRYGESDIGYEKQSDTWFINSVYPNNPMLQNDNVELLSVEDLMLGFDKIKIAPQDNFFIMDKEITREQYPEFF
ncbi:MAG: hypothetical protein NC200_06430 [Candidatus Gastranaerophilales bacterium]|nr:hypothetical protein [Candidatus Gastranaerophilales bacterium]